MYQNLYKIPLANMYHFDTDFQKDKFYDRCTEILDSLIGETISVDIATERMLSCLKKHYVGVNDIDVSIVELLTIPDAGTVYSVHCSIVAANGTCCSISTTVNKVDSVWVHDFARVQS